MRNLKPEQLRHKRALSPTLIRRNTLAFALLLFSALAAAQNTPSAPTHKTAAKTTATTTPHRNGTRTTSATRAAGATTSAVPLPPGIPKVVAPLHIAYALRFQEIRLGTGPLAQPGQVYTVHYTGWLASDGTRFDSSYDHQDAQNPNGQPIQFLQGRHRVIPGWDTGFQGMRVGGKRRLFIPYQLAYGDQGRPPVIPPHSDLIFDVELVNAEDLPQPPQAMPGMNMPPAPQSPPAPPVPPQPPAPPTPLIGFFLKKNPYGLPSESSQYSGKCRENMLFHVPQPTPRQPLNPLFSTQASNAAAMHVPRQPVRFVCGASMETPEVQLSRQLSDFA